MLTDTKHIFKIKDKEPAYLSKTGIAPTVGKTYPLYIPHLMPKIKMGEPKTGAVFSKGVICFKNAPECKILTATLLKNQNYLDVPFERNKSWEGQGIKNPDNTYTINKNTKVICNCPSNSLNDLTFSND